MRYPQLGRETDWCEYLVDQEPLAERASIRRTVCSRTKFTNAGMPCRGVIKEDVGGAPHKAPTQRRLEHDDRWSISVTHSIERGEPDGLDANV
eukprot:CAMPEP_0119388790 /NCGR_PEP_ID=MMETSP1334-20130426/106515_1 /TAXON_ID=127549 /ORGANISM="Calcidiscus leptoporus, Strain RCC1130" /LENGTH=92 /DNA_ID=CAMNT_0007410875 /DNA_START=543 /DNA_END=817 /DNA_ORIENTATION=+